MLGGVARGNPGTQRQPAQVCLLAICHPAVIEGAAARRGGEDLSAVAGRKLPGTGQEISVQVRIGSEPHPQAVPPRGGPHRPQIPGRIHRQRPPVTQVHEVGGVAQPFIHHGHNPRSGHGQLPSQRFRRRERRTQPAISYTIP